MPRSPATSAPTRAHRVALARDVGLLVLRVVPSLLLALGHGLPKAAGFADKAARFPDPLGIGHTASLVLAIFGELVAPIGVALGLLTRLAALPPFFTMAVAFFLVHAGTPLGEREDAAIFGLPFLVVALVGPGRFSLDHLRAARHTRRHDQPPDGAAG